MARYTIFQFLALYGYLIVIGQSRAETRESICSIKQFDDIDYTEELGNEIKKQPFTLEEIYLNYYHLSKPTIVWDSDTNILQMENMSGISTYNIKTMEEQQIILFDDYKLPFRISLINISPDKKFILVGYNMKKVYRYSSVASYAVLHTDVKTYELIEDGVSITLAKWSPINNDLVYVHNNNIYLVSFDKQKFSKLTRTGIPGVVYNGVPDWVYEEEVFKSPITMWFSPNGDFLAFATFDDTAVKEIVYSHYGTPGSLENQYPQQVRIKYPKVGTQNPVVTLSVIAIRQEVFQQATLKAPVDVLGSDVILYDVTWWNSTHVIATWTNRVQNVYQYVMYNAQSGSSVRILREEETEGWGEPNSPLRFGDYALFLRRRDSGTSAGRFQHIVRYKFENDRFTSPIDLTSGPSEVHSIVTVDQDRGRVYYLATAPGKPEQKNLYWIPINASQASICISCVIPTPEGNTCTYATASFSTHKTHYALICTGPDPLVVTIHKADYNPNDKCMGLMFWSIFWEFRKYLAERLMPLQRDFNITVNGYNSRVRLLLPPDFDKSKKYPLLVYVYGGPNTVTIKDEASYGIEYYLTTSRDVIYARIDGRGSAFKGSKMLYEIHRRVGTVEIADTIAVTAALQKQYSWIDESRTGIWGWSYGGFTTAMVLAKDKASVFKCGISVSPVTNWLYYDSIYTEQYMGLPTADDNLAGYRRTDISAQAKGIRGKKFMIMHGSADDNVHYQQTMMLVKSLEERDILFEEITYPDEAHGLSSMHPHFYRTMDRFWSECFGLDRAR